MAVMIPTIVLCVFSGRKHIQNNELAEGREKKDIYTSTDIML